MQKILVPAIGEVRSINSRKTGAQFHIQSVGLIGNDGLAEKFDVLHSDLKDVLKPGTYTFAADAIYVSNGKLAVSTRNLVAAPAK